MRQSFCAGPESVKHLAENLSKEFGGGFSLTNRKLMRQFYVLHAERIGQTASGFFADRPGRRMGQTLNGPQAPVQSA